MRDPLRVLSVFGTRPEAIKMAPVVRALAERADVVAQVCVTAQHRELLDQVCAVFDLAVDHDLEVMSPGQTPAGVLARVVAGLEPVLAEARPDWVLVQGDTTTAMAAAITAAYHGARVAHVEAGLRTFDKRRPFPEELNRLLVAAAGDLHFAPTAMSARNLLREGHDPDSVVTTGNTVIDALMWTRDRLADLVPADPLDELTAGRRIVLVTAHRRENFGRPIREAFGALAELARRFDDSVVLVCPVHPNPNVSGPAHEILGAAGSGVVLVDPLDYPRLVRVMDRAHLVVTDSGGIQEEAPSLGKPVLVLRDVTERPEAVAAGTVRLVGCDAERILSQATRLLTDDAAHHDMARRANPYGDGRAAGRIVAALLGEPVDQFEVPDDPVAVPGAGGADRTASSG